MGNPKWQQSNLFLQTAQTLQFWEAVSSLVHKLSHLSQSHSQFRCTWTYRTFIYFCYFLPPQKFRGYRGLVFSTMPFSKFSEHFLLSSNFFCIILRYKSLLYLPRDEIIILAFWLLMKLKWTKNVVKTNL